MKPFHAPKKPERTPASQERQGTKNVKSAIRQDDTKGYRDARKWVKDQRRQERKNGDG